MENISDFDFTIAITKKQSKDIGPYDFPFIKVKERR
jgi:hypothetical protein